MSVLDRELFHGAALSQIVESGSFASIRKASAAYGHYEINDRRRILIRHSRASRGPWYFTLNTRDLRPLNEDTSAGRIAFLCLVCGIEAICLLTHAQFPRVIALDSYDAQSIRVNVRPNSSFEVTGSQGMLQEKVPRHAFPGGLFR